MGGDPLSLILDFTLQLKTIDFVYLKVHIWLNTYQPHFITKITVTEYKTHCWPKYFSTENAEIITKFS